MRIRLKDRELQRKLDALVPPDGFTYALNDVQGWECTNRCGSEWLEIRIWFGRHSYRLPLSEVEMIDDYVPERWNAFPEVDPPEGVWMRVECAHGECGYKAKFEEGRWVDGRGHEIFGEPGDKLGPFGRPVCFRPWDDGDTY